MGISFQEVQNKRQKLIQSLLDLDLFTREPLVLADIGSSQLVNEKWNESLLIRSILILCDADDRDFDYEIPGAIRTVKLRDIIAPEDGSNDFYLTKSPYCSSVLEPYHEELQNWSFAGLFAIEKKTTLPSRSLRQALADNGITYIDWYKSDIQGLDLKVFTSLSKDLQSRVLHAEFEPGILKAYKGEDFADACLKFMREQGFWLEDIVVNGPERVNRETLLQYGIDAEFYQYNRNPLKRSPGWLNLSFLREVHSGMSDRETAGLFLFSILEDQYGFCLEILEKTRGRISTGLHTFLETHFLDFFRSFDAYHREQLALQRERETKKPVLKPFLKSVVRKVRKLFQK